MKNSIGKRKGKRASSNDEFINGERQKARELRKTKWWRNKTSQGHCYYCNNPVPPRQLTMDHLIPLSKGGKSIRSNLVAACKECNNKKTHLLPFEWDDWVQ